MDVRDKIPPIYMQNYSKHQHYHSSKLFHHNMENNIHLLVFLLSIFY